MTKKTILKARAVLEAHLRRRSNNVSMVLRTGEAKIILALMDDLEVTEKALAKLREKHKNRPDTRRYITDHWE